MKKIGLIFSYLITATICIILIDSARSGSAAISNGLLLIILLVILLSVRQNRYVQSQAHFIAMKHRLYLQKKLIKKESEPLTLTEFIDTHEGEFGEDPNWMNLYLKEYEFNYYNLEENITEIESKNKNQASFIKIHVIASYIIIGVIALIILNI